MEKRHNFVRKVAETAVKCFIKDDKVSCVGLILAGSADFKTELNGSGRFHILTPPLLHAKEQYKAIKRHVRSAISREGHPNR